MDERYRVDALRYAQFTIRLLERVPDQRVDPVARREALSNIEVIQSRLDHLSPALSDALSAPLRDARNAAEGQQLGLTLACMERVRDLLDQAESAD
jgi:hypothetical protein